MLSQIEIRDEQLKQHKEELEAKVKQRTAELEQRNVELQRVVIDLELAKEAGAKRVIPLVVSGAIHSPLMEEAQAGLKNELASADFRDAELPVYTNVMAEPAVEKAGIKDLLYKQLTHPVRWTELITNMISAGVDTFYEVGPGNVLTGLMKRIDRSVSCTAIGTFEQIDAIV